MADPIITQIGANFLLTLQGVTVANGYNQTIAPQWATRLGNSPLDLTVWVHKGDPIQEESSSPCQYMQWLQPYALECHVVNSDSGGSVFQRIERLEADITKALMADVSRGGLARDTIPESPQIFRDIKGVTSGVLLMYDVRYVHLYSDPYHQ